MARKRRSRLAASDSSACTEASAVRHRALALAAECRKADDQNLSLLAAHLVAGGPPFRRFGWMQPSEVAQLFHRSETWVRVHVFFARLRFPCEGVAGDCECRDCVDQRGQQILRAMRLKALNTPESK